MSADQITMQQRVSVDEIAAEIKAIFEKVFAESPDGAVLSPGNKEKIVSEITEKMKDRIADVTIWDLNMQFDEERSEVTMQIAPKMVHVKALIETYKNAVEVAQVAEVAPPSSKNVLAPEFANRYRL